MNEDLRGPDDFNLCGLSENVFGSYVNLCTPVFSANAFLSLRTDVKASRRGPRGQSWTLYQGP